MSRILPLQPDAIAQLNSSKHITSLGGVVLALLENSLDAGSTKVEITINVSHGRCTVEDNGAGIPFAEFTAEGGLCKMHHTSKHAHVPLHEIHGVSGTYLASLSALSYLSITSCEANEEQSATLVTHQGKVISRQLPSSPGQDYIATGGHGTRVVVRDLFGNMPVRLKQRAIANASGVQDFTLWHEIKAGVVALLLAWPRPCAVRLRDAYGRQKGVHLTAQPSFVSSALTARSLNSPTGLPRRYDLRHKSPILVQADLVPPGSHGDWISVSASTNNVSVKGLISLQPAPTKRCQFMSINITPCDSTSGFNELYDVVNKVFANSSFGCVDDTADFDEKEKDRRKTDRRYKTDGYIQKQLLGRKGVDRWPSFVLQLQLIDLKPMSLQTKDITDGSLKAMTDVLEVLSKQWLEKHNFRPHKRRRRRNESQQGPMATTSSPYSPAKHSVEKVQTQTPILGRSPTGKAATTSREAQVCGHTWQDSRLRGSSTKKCAERQPRFQHLESHQGK